ncbi:MAG TPA: hypothetical protein VMB73_21715, partial [Acetobacteraceae bacterium]|nr:hypothetical protein [Acetobacteraceae bacterium]
MPGATLSLGKSGGRDHSPALGDDLLEDLLTHSNRQHLLLIGAYRDNEVSATHPLMRTLDTIRRPEARVQEIRLTPIACD